MAPKPGDAFKYRLAVLTSIVFKPMIDSGSNDFTL